MEWSTLSQREAARVGRTQPGLRRDDPFSGDAPFQHLLAAARANAGWAWEAIYRAHAPSLLGYLRSQGAPSPEDLLGDVFVALVRDLERFSGSPEAFRAWTFRIAQNRLIDARRRERRRPQIADAEPPPIPDAGDGPGARLEQREVLALLGALPADQRAVLFLRFVADLSQREIADVLGKRLGAVKMLQRRARDRLAGDPAVQRYLSGRGDA